MIASSFPADLNPARFVARRAALAPTSPAIVYDGGDLTIAQLDDQVGSTAAALLERGVSRADRVVYLGLNSPTLLVTLLAAQRIGAVFVPINFRLAAPEVAEILRVADAVAVVAEEGHRELLESIESSSLRTFLLVDDDPTAPLGPDRDARWELLSHARESAGEAPVPVQQGFDNVAILMFTSGTTGTPKGVILTAGNIWWNCVNVDTVVDTRKDDVTLAIAPLFHIGGLNSFTMRVLVRGGCVVVRRVFDPARTLQDVVDLAVNSMFAVPAMWNALARTPGFFEADLSNLRATIVAAAPVPRSLIAEFAEHGLLLQQAWGLTETAPFSTYLPPELTLTKIGSAGLPMPFTEVAVVDPIDGETKMAPGVPGEILVRGTNVTSGYWRNEAATEAAFDAEGWFHTGDIGHLDEDGCLFVVDRLKDMIISGGENVYPAEVEMALADMPGVLDVAVVGAAHESWGETVVAVLSVEPGSDITIDAVRDHTARTLARYKLPSVLRLVEVMPRNAAGKLDKIAIRHLTSEPE